MRSQARHRREVAEFVNILSRLGPVAAIGGMLRDLYLSGNRGFISDVDFVIHPDSLRSFDSLMARIGAKRTRFGGRRLCLGHWKADVWPLQRTWAHLKGHVEIKTFDDLTNATFFDWDAIVYVIHENRLIASPSYYNRIDNRILDVNLHPNPNPLGNAVRALRYAWRWQATLGPRLANHVLIQAHDCGWDALTAAEETAFSRRVLNRLDPDKILIWLKQQERIGSEDAVRLPFEEFPFK